MLCISPLRRNCCWVTSVVSNSVQPHGWQPTRLPHPWDAPGKNTGVVCHFLLQCMKVKSEREVAQSCPTPGDPRTAAYQAPPSMGFARQEYWSGVPLPSLGLCFIAELLFQLSLPFLIDWFSFFIFYIPSLLQLLPSYPCSLEHRDGLGDWNFFYKQERGTWKGFCTWEGPAESYSVSQVLPKINEEAIDWNLALGAVWRNGKGPKLWSETNSNPSPNSEWL